MGESMTQQLGKKYYEREMERYNDTILPPTSTEHSLVQRIFERIVASPGLAADTWKLYVINDPVRQAFVLPGGEVFVHTGLLNFCESEDEIAVVLGHEIMHRLMQHTSETLSRVLPLIFVDYLFSLASGIDQDLVGLATDVMFLLPRSRAQETEADYFGVQLAAKSGYDPSAALSMWSRWEALEEEVVPEYLHTHPPHHQRLVSFHSWLSEAKRTRLQGRSQGASNCSRSAEAAIRYHTDPSHRNSI